MRPAVADPAPAARDDILDRSRTDPLATAERLAPAIEAHAAETEAAREMAPAVFQLLLDAGFYKLLLPRSYGGYELPPSRFGPVIERVARADGSVAWCLGQTAGCAMAAGYLAPKVAREIFEPHRAVLAWGSGPKGKAIPVPGGYEVTGLWMFASGGRQADWLGCHSFLCNPDGTQRQAPDGKPATRTLLFPANQAKMTDVWYVMGLKGTGSDNYSVEKLFVPEERTFFLEGTPDKSQQGVLFRFPITLLYATGFSSVAIGLAGAMLDAFIDLAGAKTPHAQKGLLRDNAVIQSQVAVAEAKLASARMFLWHSLEEIEAELAATAGQLTAAQRMRIRLAATFGIHQAKEVADIAYRGAGSTAILENGKFERRFRDLHAVTQQLQGRQAHFETVGQFMLGLNDDPPNH